MFQPKRFTNGIWNYRLSICTHQHRASLVYFVSDDLHNFHRNLGLALLMVHN